jgi:methionyl-tRNA formyltransferase
MSSKSPSPLKLVFLGTPEVVVLVAESLRLAPELCDIAMVVTAPPTRRGRGSKSEGMLSPVHLWAESHGIECETPQSVKDEGFLSRLAAMQPDVCVTAAYGQYLPVSFLRVPRFGTLNIHPSLLPAFRGAAPVQRALQAGCAVSGVTVLFSEARMDAGPIVAQRESGVGQDEDAALLMSRLFAEGAALLRDALKTLRDEGLDALNRRSIVQDEAMASYAPKILAQDAFVDPTQLDAREIINRIRAFAMWPGVKINLRRGEQTIEVRLLRGEVDVGAGVGLVARPEGDVWFDGLGLCVSCKGGSSVLRVLELQLPGKRAMLAAEARNGWPGGKPVLVLKLR